MDEEWQRVGWIRSDEAGTRRGKGSASGRERGWEREGRLTLRCGRLRVCSRVCREGQGRTRAAARLRGPLRGPANTHTTHTGVSLRIARGRRRRVQSRPRRLPPPARWLPRQCPRTPPPARPDPPRRCGMGWRLTSMLKLRAQWCLKRLTNCEMAAILKSRRSCSTVADTSRTGSGSTIGVGARRRGIASQAVAVERRERPTPQTPSRRPTPTLPNRDSNPEHTRRRRGAFCVGRGRR